MEENNKDLQNVDSEEIEKNEKILNQEAQKKIEVVTGDGDLTISPVYEHLEVEKPKPKENRKIFIPEVKNTTTKKDDNSEEENSDNS